MALLASLVSGFEALSQFSELVGDLFGDARAPPGRVEGERVGPDQAEAFADDLVFEVGQQDAVIAGVGEGLVVAAGARPVGINADGVADVADQDEGRPPPGDLRVGQQAGVIIGLVLGAQHRLVVGRRAAFAVAGALAFCEVAGAVGGGKSSVLHTGTRADPLFVLQNKVAPLIAVDELGVPVLPHDPLFEHVVVLGRIGHARVRLSHPQQLAKVIDERLRVGRFRGPGLGPFLDEGGGCLGHLFGWVGKGRGR